MAHQPDRRHILVIASALDLEHKLGCTPAWWQLLKALWKADIELTCIPYLGAAIRTPWWTAVENPCYRMSIAFAAARARINALNTPKPASGKGTGRLSQHIVNGMIASQVRPRWRRAVTRVLEIRPDTDCLVNLGVPPRHLEGIPSMVRNRFGTRTWFYDGDLPASMPEHGGFDTGFRVYDSADLAEYDGVICNSEGSLDFLLKMGAREAHAVHWAADPDFFPQIDARPEVDVGFYGFGDKHRESWIRSMIGIPSDSLPDLRFRVWGGGFQRGSLGSSALDPGLSFNRIPGELSRVRVHLNITRTPHATVMASSSARPFEIAALGGAMVSNPVVGIERWFEPGREVCMVHDETEAIETYNWLVRDRSARRRLGKRARDRLLEEHTYDHRAATLLGILGLAESPHSR